MKIISMLYIDGKWTEQDNISEKEQEKIIQDTMEKAGLFIGAELQTDLKRRRAGNITPPAV